MAAMLDPKEDFVGLEGPLRGVDKQDYFKATYIGWGIPLGAFKAESDSASRALQLMAEALREHGQKIIDMRAEQLAKEATWGRT